MRFSQFSLSIITNTLLSVFIFPIVIFLVRSIFSIYMTYKDVHAPHIFFKKDFIYLFERESKSMSRGRGRGGETGRGRFNPEQGTQHDA